VNKIFKVKYESPTSHNEAVCVPPPFGGSRVPFAWVGCASHGSFHPHSRTLYAIVDNYGKMCLWPLTRFEKYGSLLKKEN
jgi:hypothetical protein